MSNKSHTRKSDELLIMEFVYDNGWDQPDLLEAAERLEACHADELQDYSVPAERSSLTDKE